MRQMSQVEAAYLAGLFDGEGCISITFREPNPNSREKQTQVRIQVSLAMTDEEVIRKIGEITGTENKVYPIKPRKDFHKEQWNWRPNLSDAYNILSQCLPYILVKKKNVELFIELMDIRKTSTRIERKWDRQQELVLQSMALNKRGV